MEFTQCELIMMQSSLKDRIITLEEVNKTMDVEVNLKEAKSALEKVQKYLRK